MARMSLQTTDRPEHMRKYSVDGKGTGREVRIDGEFMKMGLDRNEAGI